MKKWLFIALLVLFMFGVIFMVIFNNSYNETEKITDNDMINIVDNFIELTKDKVVVVYLDNEGNENNTKEETELVKIKENVLGIDVSQFNIIGQKSIENPNDNFVDENDFVKFITENNIGYVYIRLGGRGWGQKGNMYLDSNTSWYAKKCDENAIPYGFYFLDEALNEEEVYQEVQFVKSFLEENDFQMNLLPLALDMENQHGKGRTDNIWESRTYLANMLVDEFSKIGIETIIYANGARIETYLKSANCKFWVAMYPEQDIIPNVDYSTFVKQEQSRYMNNLELLEGSVLNTELNKGDTDTVIYSDEFLNKVVAWQFSENGAVNDGIEEYIDLNLTDKEYFEKYTK